MAAKDFSLLNKGSDIVTSEYCCSSCDEGGHNIEAEFYCGNCVKFYCVSCITPHRQLFKTHTVHGRGEMAKWPVARATQYLLEKCEVHTDKKSELFCGDHKQLCCNTCISLSHRRCTKVSLISDTVKLKSSADFQQTLSDIKIVLDQLMKRQESSKSSMQSLKASYEVRLQEIRDVRQKLTAALDKMEKTTLKEMGNIMTSLNTPVKEDIDNSTKLLKELKLFRDTMQDIGDRNKELSFIAWMKSQEMMKQSETFLLDNSVKDGSLLSFQANTDVERYLNKLSGLGKVATTQSNLGNPDQVINVKGTEKFKLNMAGNSKMSFDIVGKCGLPNGEMIVADRKNSKVFLLDKEYEAVSQCDVTASPQDVCLISVCEVAVTVDEEVQIISVSKGRLVKGRKLQLGHECVGITCYQGSLYVTSGTALYHYTLTGRLLNKLYEDTSSTRTVLKCAVSPFGDKIYVTNNSHHKLLTLARDGTVLSTFTDLDLKCPTGVHVTPVGQVLVCGHKSNAIIQVDCKGKKKLSTLATGDDGVLRPVSVYQYTDSVVVSQWASWQILVLNLE